MRRLRLRALADPELLARHSGEEAGPVRALLDELAAAAPELALLKARIEAGAVAPGMDIAPFVADAARLIIDARDLARRQGGSVARLLDEMLASPDVLDGAVAPLTRALVAKMPPGGKAARAGEVAEFLRAYAREAMEAGRTEGFGFDAPGPLDVLRRLDKGTFGDLTETGRPFGEATAALRAPDEAVLLAFDEGAASPAARGRRADGARPAAEGGGGASAGDPKATAAAPADLVASMAGGAPRRFVDIRALAPEDEEELRRLLKAGQAGFEAWAGDIEGKLAWDRIIDHRTGKPFSLSGRVPRVGARHREFLADVYKGITTRGWDDREPSLSLGGRALYAQRAEHRQLHFRDGDAAWDYNQAFGTADPFTAIVGGLHGMATDVALMRVLGPNPKAGLEFAAQAVAKKVATERHRSVRTWYGKKITAEQHARINTARAKTMLAIMDGSNNVPVDEFFASFFGGTRQVLTSIQLGSAAVSAVTDLRTVTMGARVAGMNGSNVLARATRLALDAQERGIAAQLGYIADSLADMGAAASRYTGETLGPEVAERLSSFTMRASGLQLWTDMLRLAFQSEFAAVMGAQAGRSFDQLEPELRELFEARGIRPADWDALRSPDTLFEPRPGAVFLSPRYWLEATSMPRAEAEGLAIRLQMLIEEQLEIAIPSMSVEGRAIMLGDPRPHGARGPRP